MQVTRMYKYVLMWAEIHPGISSVTQSVSREIYGKFKKQETTSQGRTSNRTIVPTIVTKV